MVTSGFDVKVSPLTPRYLLLIFIFILQCLDSNILPEIATQFYLTPLSVLIHYLQFLGHSKEVFGWFGWSYVL